MNTPGPPRFVAVGESVELAPWDPDPETATDCQWHIIDAPAESRAVVEQRPVVQFRPDTAGSYRLELETPDGRYPKTVRAFPSERRETRIELPFERLPVDPDTLDSISVVGPFNDQLVGRNRPTKLDDRFVLDVELPPGEHGYGFCLDDDLSRQVHDSVAVPGPGRPRCRLDGVVVDAEAVEAEAVEAEAVEEDVDGTNEHLVVTATATAAPDSEYSDDDLDLEFVVDDRDHVADDVIEIDGRTCRIPVDAIGERLRIHAVAVGERRSVADTLDVQRTNSALEIVRPNDPPEWAESPTIYEIFVRSFTGETLPTTFREIERRVGYLQSLAVDVLWLTPVLASPTTHGYHITDYFRTADDLGSRAAFESLIDRCHDAGIKVVFDLVINHTSRDHPAFQLHSAGVDKYADYYNRVPSERDSTGVEWAGEGSPEFYFNWQRIPNLNYESLAVRRWMLDVVDEWAEVVDGFRCDVAWGVSHGFWKEVRDRVPDDFLLLDETIPRDPFYHESEFQMHYDTSLYGTLRDIGSASAPASAIFEALDDAQWQGFPESAVHLRYVENHDEPRYLDECDEAALRAAAAATLTLPGAPMLYYGQERGMTEQRGPMKWYNGDAELTEFHRSLAKLRREQPALKTGGVEPLSVAVVDVGGRLSERKAATESADSNGDTDAENNSGGDSNGDTGPVESEETDTNGADEPKIEIDTEPYRVTAFARDDGEDRLIVVLNFNHEPRTVRLPESVGSTDLVTGNPLRKRYDPAADDKQETYVVVEDVLVCQASQNT